VPPDRRESEFVEQALAQEHEVTALVRNPDKLQMQHNPLRTVKGDVLDADSLLTAMQQQQAVISSLGTKKLVSNP